jgi:hypothetical protein
MIHFLNITIQSKASDDWRAFLDWADDSTMTRYQLRGYGSTPGEAADDAWKRYNEDRDFYIEDESVWK